MIVKELIKFLKKCDPEERVIIELPGDDEYNRYDPLYAQPVVVSETLERHRPGTGWESEKIIKLVPDSIAEKYYKNEIVE